MAFSMSISSQQSCEFRFPWVWHVSLFEEELQLYS